MDDYSDLYEPSPEELGLQSYCFVVAQLLSELHPNCRFFRITNMDKFDHVVIEKSGVYIDIRGKHTKEQLLNFDEWKGMELIETSIEEIMEYFMGFTEQVVFDIVKERLLEYIDNRRENYT